MSSTTHSDPQNKDDSFSIFPNLPQTYEWFPFPCSSPEICYLTSFLKDKPPSSIDLSKLDLEDFTTHPELKSTASVSNIVKDQYLRILKYGNISSYVRDSTKSPQRNLVSENEYDLRDPFIDDSTMDQGLIKMEVYQAGFDDYLCYAGGLNGLLNTQHYKNRIGDLENIRKFTAEEQKIYLKKKPVRGKSKKSPKVTIKPIAPEKEKKVEVVPQESLTEMKEKTVEVVPQESLIERSSKKIKTPAKNQMKIEVIEVASDQEEKKETKDEVVFFTNLRPDLERKEIEGEMVTRSQTSSVKKIEGKPKKSVQTKASKNKNNSKQKRDSIAKKEEIFNENHPTLGKFKMAKKK